MEKRDNELIGLFHPCSLGFCHSIPHNPDSSHPALLLFPKHTKHLAKCTFAHTVLSNTTTLISVLQTPTHLPGSITYSMKLSPVRKQRQTVFPIRFATLFIPLLLYLIETCLNISASYTQLLLKERN